MSQIIIPTSEGSVGLPEIRNKPDPASDPPDLFIGITDSKILKANPPFQTKDKAVFSQVIKKKKGKGKGCEKNGVNANGG